MIAPDDPAAATADQPREAELSTVALLSELADAAGLLLRQQLALLKCELGQQLASIGLGAVALAAGAVIVFSGWCGLLAAATLALCFDRRAMARRADRRARQSGTRSGPSLFRQAAARLRVVYPPPHGPVAA